MPMVIFKRYWTNLCHPATSPGCVCSAPPWPCGRRRRAAGLASSVIHNAGTRCSNGSGGSAPQLVLLPCFFLHSIHCRLSAKLAALKFEEAQCNTMKDIAAIVAYGERFSAHSLRQARVLLTTCRFGRSRSGRSGCQVPGRQVSEGLERNEGDATEAPTVDLCGELGRGYW